MKRSRAWRRHQNNRVIQKRKKFVKEYGGLPEMEDHRLVKKHPLDCGCSECKVCHPSKYYESGNSKDYHYIKDHPDVEDLYEDYIEGEYENAESHSWE